MSQCPKCGSIEISKPVYRLKRGKESLLFTCRNCGYVEERACRDAQATIPPILKAAK